jgi:hypothetical protein
MWLLHVEADGADDTLTAAAAVTLKASVITALAGITHTTATFSTDALPGQAGPLEPPMTSSITRQAKAAEHIATRN